MKTLYYNGTVYDGDELTEAFIVENGRFVYCGSLEEGLKLLDETDERHDLQGRFVCAGFNDSHMHLLNYGQFLSLARLNEHTGSLEDLLNHVTSFRKEKNLSGSKWLKGRGWNQDYFTDVKRMPTRYDIDKVIPDVPVMLTRACGHCCVVNSKALEIAGITEETVAPEGGAIGKENGKLNGLFFDNAIELINKVVPVPGKNEIKEMIVTACKALNSYGITSSQSDDYGVFREIPFEVINEAYKELEAEGRLTVRVYEQSNFTELDELKRFVNSGNVTGEGSDNFKIGPLKMVEDGSLGGRTAWLSQPYADDETTCGFPLFSDEHINEMVEFANANNMQIAVHAIGDRCLDQILNAYEKALSMKPREDHRHGIVHCQISRKDQLERIAEMNLHVYAQSIFLDYDNHIVEARVGKELASTSYSWKTLMNKGVSVSNGSDAPVELPDVMKGIQCAVTRESTDGYGPYLKHEAFTVKEALDSFTSMGAYSSFEEEYKGKIKENHLADFVVLERNPFECDPHELGRIRILETYMKGNKVFQEV